MRIAACAIGPLSFLLACAGCSKPAPFSRGERIPLGPFTLSVSHAEMSSLDTRAQSLAVHFRSEGIDSQETAKRFAFLFMGQITVTDSEGNEYATLPLMTLGAFRSKRLSRGAGVVVPDGEFTPNEWVAVARVPVGSQGFVVHIKNPRRQEGQPSVASVALGR